MTWFVFLTAYCVLSYSTVPVAGQCTVSSCAVSASGSEESLQVSLEEHDYILETMNQNMCSAFEKLESVVNRTNANLTSMIVRTDERIQAVNEKLLFTFQTVNRSFDGKLQIMNETLSSAIDEISVKVNAILDLVNENLQYSRSQGHCRNTSIVCDCSDIMANGYATSGVYVIYVVDEGQRHYANVFCDMTTTNGSWMVFQRRKDGSVDFYRGWNEYAKGFGNASGEFWLGNNFLHLLTSKRRYRLRIDLEDFEGGKRYAEYSSFNISSSADKYRLRIGNYSGNAGAYSLRRNNGQRFSTKDNDNDAFSENCAVSNRGAWWYKDCTDSNLNGLYLRGNYSSNGSRFCCDGIHWFYWHGGWYSLKTTEMKISSS